MAAESARWDTGHTTTVSLGTSTAVDPNEFAIYGVVQDSNAGAFILFKNGFLLGQSSGHTLYGPDGLSLGGGKGVQVS